METTYLKSTFAKEKFDGNMIEFELNQDEIATSPAIGGKVYLKMVRRKTLGKYGESHFIVLNDYRYARQEEGLQSQEEGSIRASAAGSDGEDDLPF